METHFTTHAESRTDAVQILITDPIEATGVVTDAAAEYDLDALADALLTYHPSSLPCPLGYGGDVHVTLPFGVSVWNLSP